MANNEIEAATPSPAWNTAVLSALRGAEAAHVSASSCEDALTFKSMKFLLWHTKLS